MAENFEIISKEMEEYQIQIKDNSSSNDLLNALIGQGEIISFEEKIPTMEDIFIKAVKDE